MIGFIMTILTITLRIDISKRKTAIIGVNLT